MGGPGAGRVTGHELNAVPKSNVGHGDRILVIGEPPAPGCPCHSACPARGLAQGVVSAQSPASPPSLTSLHIANNNNCSILNGNNRNRNRNRNRNSNTNNNNKDDSSNVVPNGSSNNTTAKAKAAAAMSSPPKHRRGFDPNDANVNDYRRYRRVKTKQRSLSGNWNLKDRRLTSTDAECTMFTEALYVPHRDLGRRTQTFLTSPDTSTSTKRLIQTHTKLAMFDVGPLTMVVYPPP
ncbi:potassium voltage-gated channel protein Shaker isoform X8 [Vespula squamosa]|uniref:Potassium voltage-gated channel protein Shaker isoform X8 n=1 Tax=Vespula squamosa TaxID=30214 RepID=A0ABD2AGQ6_VESSQ